MRSLKIPVASVTPDVLARVSPLVVHNAAENLALFWFLPPLFFFFTHLVIFIEFYF